MAKQIKKPKALRPGSKLARVYDWIKAQMIGTELVFSREHIEQLMILLDVKKDVVIYDTVRFLAKRGLIIRTKRTGEGRGFIITLPDPNTTSTPAAEKPQKVKSRAPQEVKRDRASKATSVARELTVRELMKQLDVDIKRLEVELAEKRAFRKTLEQATGR